jgi:hypothetical protein
MIDFRYHIVSLVAVFLALALGLFLGSTTLQNVALHGITTRVDKVTQEYRDEVNAFNAQSAQVKGDEQFLTALAPFALHDGLIGDTVAIVSMPGVASSVGDTLVTELESQSSATVTARVQIESSLFDPAQSAVLDTLTSRLHVPGVTAAGSSGAERALTQLAAVIGSKPGRPPVPASREQTVLSAYSAASLLSVDGGSGSVRPASLTVVLAPDPSAFPTARQAADDGMVADLATDLSTSSGGSVLAGPVTATNSGGALQIARSAAARPADLATVQGVDTEAGQIAVAFALVEVSDGRSGDFGPGSSTPLPATSPNP